MVKTWNKQCVECSEPYKATGPAGKYCPTCAPAKLAETALRGSLNFRRRTCPGFGKGKGGMVPRGDKHPSYKHGRYAYHTLVPEIKAEVRYCEDCGKDLKDATHYMWVVHHRDHNKYNYARENLALLCKRCHQIEHKCWKAFEGATTISIESTPKQAEAPDILRDDDIVCSTSGDVAGLIIRDTISERI